MYRFPKLLLITLAAVVLAQVPAAAEAGRYTMTPTKDGVLRLDTETGEVALCENTSEQQWTCQAIKDNSSDLKRRIEELEQENADLKAQLAAGGNAAPGTGKPDGMEALPRPEGKLDIPSEQDVDKAMDFVERMLKRFKGIMKDLREQDNNKEGVPL